MVSRWGQSASDRGWLRTLLRFISDIYKSIIYHAPNILKILLRCDANIFIVDIP